MVRRLAIGCLALSACFVDSSPNEGEGGETGTTGTGEVTNLVTGISASASAGTSSTTTGSSSEGSTGSGTDPTDPTSGSSTTAETSVDGSTSTSARTDTSGSSGSGDESSTGDGVLLASELVRGDLLITEVMGDPTCTGDNCEWFEIYNTTPYVISLTGLGVGDRTNGPTPEVDGQVSADVLLESGGFAVLVKQPLNWPYDAEYDAAYGPNPSLNNGSPERVYIFTPAGEVLDETAIFTNQSENQGRAFTLRPQFWGVDDNDDSSNWCRSADDLVSSAGTEWGTPGSEDVNCVL